MIYTFDLSDKIILITGGYGYLGKAITESLVYHGATVYVLGRSQEKFNNTFDSNTEKEGRLFFENCDISKTDSIKMALKKVYDSSGRIDVLINNAFYLEGQNPYQMTDKEWNTGIDGTLSSVFRCIREVIPYFEKNKSSRVINVSSMYGVVAPDFSVYDNFEKFLNPPHYGAAKAGVIQLTKYYASLLGEKNITVNCVTPGPYPSEEVQKSDSFIKKLADKTALKRIGEPKDLAGAFIFLSSDTSNYVTGQNIIVDGGWTIK
jgi:gluconate 5-dehydrogenase